jgi:MYXO-CTERM domain-containing protein
MLPIGFILTLLAGAAAVMAVVGLYFWAIRWFPKQRWIASFLVLLFVFLLLLARHTKWGILLLGLLVLAASAFIPRRR